MYKVRFTVIDASSKTSNVKSDPTANGIKCYAGEQRFQSEEAIGAWIVQCAERGEIVTVASITGSTVAD